MNKVSILIPSRFDNRWVLDLTLRCIRKYTTDIPYNIIIGDTGIEGEAIKFLKKQQDIEIVKCPDPIRPKDHLARIVKTPFFVFLHDDAQVLKPGWLRSRLTCMERDSAVGIVGPVNVNYLEGFGRFRKFIDFSPLIRRFFPFGMLVRKETQDDLDLFWGIIKGFDTGGIAYLQFLRQKRWKLVRYEFKKDIWHWGQMTWVLKKRDKTSLDLPRLQHEREQKIAAIRKILEQEQY